MKIPVDLRDRGRGRLSRARDATLAELTRARRHRARHRRRRGRCAARTAARLPRARHRGLPARASPRPLRAHAPRPQPAAARDRRPARAAARALRRARSALSRRSPTWSWIPARRASQCAGRATLARPSCETMQWKRRGVAARRAALSDPHRRRACSSGRSSMRRTCAAARRDRHQRGRRAALSRKRAKRRSDDGRARRPRSCLPDGEQAKSWQTLNSVFDALLEARCGRDDADRRAGRRRGRRPGGLRRRDLSARHAVRAGAHHAARAGRLLGRRQDRDQPCAGQEHDRRLPPAARRDLGRRDARHAARRASCAPASPR